MSSAPLVGFTKTSPDQPLVFKCSSISNASLDRYPLNTPTNFTHFLPGEVFLQPDKQYVISLKSMYLPTKRLANVSLPAYIRVHLKQLRHNIWTTPDQAQCLAQLVLPDRSRTSTKLTLDWYEIDNPVPLLLDRTLRSIRQLDFMITDENNKELQISDITPTTVNCYIEEMDVVNRFTVTLNPSISKTLFPTNTDHDFIVDFGSPITSDVNWEMALHSVIVPAGINILGENFVYTIKLKNDQEKSFTIVNTGQTADKIIRQIKIRCRKMGVWITNDGVNHLRIYFPDKSKVASLNFNPSLCKLLGMIHVNARHGHTFKSDFTRRELSFPYGAKLIRDKTISPSEQVVLYSSLVQTSIFGDERIPLVDILSAKELGLIENNSNADTLFSLPHLTFRPVNRANITNVSIKIRDINGKIIDFEYSADEKEIQYIFVFRKI